MSQFRLNRTAFKAHTAYDAAKHAQFYKNLNWQDRLRIANYLNSIAFGYSEDAPPGWTKADSVYVQENKMGKILNIDFSDFINALNTQNVKYILLGGYSNPPWICTPYR